MVEELRELASKGAHIELKGGRISFRVNKITDTEEIISKLKPYKNETDLWLINCAYPLTEITIFPASEKCIKNNACYMFSTNCRLFPLTVNGQFSGFCRQRLRLISGKKAVS